jgi:ABC-type transporter Mla subunit MlaD
VVQLGLCTQRVLEGATAVDLAALNAMLSAHQASRQARGFRTAAAQMRVFSTELTELMQRVAAAVAELSDEVGRLCQRGRLENHLSQAAAGLVQPDARLLQLMAGLDHASGQARERLRRQGLRLGRAVQQALRLCDAGRNLARCALIEAAHAQDMAAQLTQVAIDLGQAVAGIIDVLDGMPTPLERLAP